MSTSTDNWDCNGYIGVFDSGVGGISTLRALTRELPHENFLFFGDSKHAPYGEKTTEEVRELSLNIADHMAEGGCKAIVIACNTATSAAAAAIRKKYQPEIPIIGVEPALKPAAEADEDRDSRILVMATPVTLTLEKFQKLEKRLSHEAVFLPVACPGLAARIEQGHLEDPDLLDLLDSLIGAYRGTVDGIVLGCTHYPFIKRQIRTVMGDVPLFDGGEGTARELHRVLHERGLETDRSIPGTVRLMSSLESEEELQLYHYLYEEAPL